MDETTKKSVDYGLSSYQDEDEGVVSEVRLKVSSQIFVPEANVLIFLSSFVAELFSFDYFVYGCSVDGNMGGSIKVCPLA
jgi:hypothetical protein